MAIPKKSMLVQSLQTRIFQKGESLVDFIMSQVPNSVICEKMILVITSKIVSLAESRVVPMSSTSKEDLVRSESDLFLGEGGYGCYLTIKQGLFIASAGIDESNSQNGDYILYPKDPYQSLQTLHPILKAKWKLQELGLLMTDSHTTPLRKGVTGISLAHWGFIGVKSHIGHQDLFGRSLKMTTVNWADGLAASATLLMGEADEACPLACIHHAAVEFKDIINPKEVQIPWQDDLYYPIFKKFQ